MFINCSIYYRFRYPWWPAIVCEDPSSHKFEIPKQIHVQFFDDPVSHAWIGKRDLKPYTDLNHPGNSVKPIDKKLKPAIELAEEALNLDREARFKLIGDLNIEEYNENNSNQMLVDESDEALVMKPQFKTPLKRKKASSIGSDISNDENSFESENMSKSTQKKRFKKVPTDSSDDDEKASEEDEYKPNEEESTNESVSDVHSDEDIDTTVEDEDEEDEFIKEKKGKKRPAKAAFGNRNKSFASKSKNVSMSFSMSKKTNNNNTTTPAAVTHNEAVDREWPHLSYQFLQPDKIADSKQRRMVINGGELNPEYDSSTLFVPQKFLDDQTPAIRQF